MRWSAHAMLGEDMTANINSAADSLRGELDGLEPHLVLAFASPALDDDCALKLSQTFPSAVIVGAAASGVIGGHQELEHRSALSLIGAHLPHTKIYVQPFGLELSEQLDVPHLKASLNPDGEDPELIISLLDPRGGLHTELLKRLDDAFPNTTVIGGLASGPINRPALLIDGRASSAGGVLIALKGGLKVEPVVSQGCRPIGQPMLVTQVEGHMIHQLGQNRPIDVMRSLHQSLPPRDQTLFQRALFLGIEMKDQLEYHQGDFLIRNILGVEAKTGGLAVGVEIEQWKAVQFHLRDAEASTNELNRLLARARQHLSQPPQIALMFSCVGRGEGLYGSPSHDTRTIREYFNDVPVGGFFCNGEVGPVGGRTYLHGYTSAMALISSVSAVESD